MQSRCLCTTTAQRAWRHSKSGRPATGFSRGGCPSGSRTFGMPQRSSPSPSAALWRRSNRWAARGVNTSWTKHQAKEIAVGTAEIAVKKSFSRAEALVVPMELGMDFETLKYDLDQFRMGLDVELEHGLRSPKTDVSGDDSVITGKIALAHLTEYPDYYTRLAVMEREAAAHWKAKRCQAGLSRLWATMYGGDAVG